MECGVLRASSSLTECQAMRSERTADVPKNIPSNPSETLASLHVWSDSLRHIGEASNMFVITFCVRVRNLVFHALGFCDRAS